MNPIRYAVVIFAAVQCFAADQPPAISRLADFGPVSNEKEIRATFEVAREALSKTGGVLVLDARESKTLPEANTHQGTWRKPEPPAPARQWGKGPGFTIVRLNQNQPVIEVPPLSGLQINRTIRMPADDSLPHWTTDFPVNIQNRVIAGANSYLEWLQEPVKAGNDARFYMKTVRGIRPGQFLNAHTGGGYSGSVQRLYVKSVGYDSAKKLHYFVADTTTDHAAGAIIHNKNNTGLIYMEQLANSDEQTYDIMLKRRQYAGGDTYMFFAWYEYMSDIHSAAGDENGNLYAGYVKSILENFRATVESVDWGKNELRFTKGNKAETLSNSRPLINLNSNKWITIGQVRIVPAESYWETTDTGKYPFQGKTYPTYMDQANERGLRMGGLIRGDKDCPWDESIIGRWFAVTERSETVHDRADLYRWYEITGLTVNTDGTKDITIRRFWWGAKNAGSPSLYREDNYTWDGHDRPLRYIIAPGAYVNRVAEAVPTPDFQAQPVLGMAPHRDAGQAFDFAKGDLVEQAIGPDPFKPIPFRMWMWDRVPGAWPAPTIDLANWGVQRFSGLQIRGGPAAAAKLPETKEGKPAWEHAITIDSAAENALRFNADVTHAAIFFAQPHGEQPIKWNYRPTTNAPVQQAALTVAKDTGQLHFTGSARFAGLSGDRTPARNLRGKNVAVNAGDTRVTVAFPVAEADGEYAVFLEQNWISNRAVVKKDASGFTVEFEKPAPGTARLDWLVVR
ncbi:MAG: hypothetical protein PCFJNLEI_03628 [Verrucomicrobiae bacterium]|nr:hypothetical protein [Verrucomicrobiae bacterium]